MGVKTILSSLASRLGATSRFEVHEETDGTISFGVADAYGNMTQSGVTAITNTLTGRIVNSFPGGQAPMFQASNQASPIIAVKSYVGSGAHRFVDFGFEPDLVIVKADSQYSVMLAREYWYGNVQAFGNTALSGSDGAPGPSIQRTGISLTALAATNNNGSTYYAIGIKDNGSGIIKTWSYNGFRNKTVGAPDNQGAASNAVSLDLIANTNPTLIHIKRDATGAGHEGVWATTSWVKKESAAAVDGTLMTLASDGTIALGTDVSINENDGMNLGEGTHVFSLHNPGQFWNYLTYIGTGAAQTIPSPGDVAAAFVIPQAAAPMQFWLSGMGTSSADGGATALYSNRITAGQGSVTIGSDASVNTAGVTYSLVVLYKTLAPEATKPRTIRPGIRQYAAGTSHIDCGTDASLGIAGAHSLEWIGSLSPFAIGGNEQFLMGRIGSATTGARGTPVAGSCNYAMAYLRDPAAGLEICTSDQFSSETTAASAQKRWRTGILLRPGEDYHILYTHDGVDKWVLYVNGVPVKWRRLPMSVFAMNGITNTAGLRMGFGGRISSGTWAAMEKTTHRFARIYNRSLTAAEVSLMFARNFIGAPLADLADTATSLVEEWVFSDQTGTTLTATKNAANNGTITSGSWVS